MIVVASEPKQNVKLLLMLSFESTLPLGALGDLSISDASSTEALESAK